MIMVTVRFPELNRNYDFKVDQNAPAEKVVDEMVRMIGQKEHIPVAKDSGFFMLCNPANQSVIDLNTSLSGCGIGNGDELILI